MSKFELKGSVGERIFAVANNGLNVYNTTEIFSSMFKAAYSVTVSKSLFLVSSYSKSFFANLGSGENKVFVEVSIGTKRRPDRMRNCFIATFGNNGISYISNLEQKWDENCPASVQ